MLGKSYGLGVETSSAAGSLSIIEITADSPRLLAEESWQKSGSHSERITLSLNGALSQVGLTLSQLTHIAVGLGPGSFTGIRVGINLVRTLAYGLNVPVYGANSLRIMAHRHTQVGQKILCLANAYKGKFYCAGYERNSAGKLETWLEPQALDAEASRSYLGQSSKSVADHLSTFENLSPGLFESPGANERLVIEAPNATDLWQVLWEDQTPATDWKSVVPLYIRASDAEEKLREGTLKLPPRL